MGQKPGALALGGNGAGGTAQIQIDLRVAHVLEDVAGPEKIVGIFRHHLRHRGEIGVVDIVHLTEIPRRHQMVRGRGEEGNEIAVYAAEKLAPHLTEHDFGDAVQWGEVDRLDHHSLASHSVARTPVRTKSSPTSRGRFTSIPSVASRASWSASLISGSLSFRPRALYCRPLVLKNRFRGRPLLCCHSRSSSFLGLSSFMSRNS